MPSYQGITYTEFKDSQMGTVSYDGNMQVKRTYDVAWNLRFDFIAAMLGFPPGPTFIGRYRDPHRDETVNFLVCHDMDYKGVGKLTVDSRGAAAYDLARFTCTYIVLKFGLSDTGDPNDRYQLEESLDFTAEFVPLVGTKYHWLSDSEPLDVPVGKIMGGQETTYSLHRVISFNTTILQSLQGCVNSDTFLGRAPGLMLFLGASSKQTFLGYNVPFKPADLVLKFRERAINWNWHFRTKKVGATVVSSWEALKETIYPPANFGQAFLSIQR